MSGPRLIYQNPKDFTGEVTVTRKPDTAIEGTPVRAYALVSVTSSGYRTTGDVYIGTQSGLPRRAISIDVPATGSRTTTYDFYDYGVRITIALPNC